MRARKSGMRAGAVHRRIWIVRGPPRNGRSDQDWGLPSTTRGARWPAVSLVHRSIL